MTTSYFILIFYFAPLLPVFYIFFSDAFNTKKGEKATYRLSLFSTLLVQLSSFYIFQDSNFKKITLVLFDWFTYANYGFQIHFFYDLLSFLMVLLSGFLFFIVLLFSRPYLHKEEGYFRFFQYLNLFYFGLNIIFTAGNLDFIFVGWEIVGICSTLLISFFYQNFNAIHNSYRAFIIYRFCDIFFLSLIAFSHLSFKSNEFQFLFSGDKWPNYSINFYVPTVIPFMLILSSLGKSAQFPFTIWPSGAMEGPTPSSTIFYGALSIHLGAFLLIRNYPMIETSQIAKYFIIFIGFITALYSSGVGRTRSDAKTSLAYATVAQVGIIYIFIGLGYIKFSIYYIICHSIIRTLQFLRAASLIQDFQENPLVFGKINYSRSIYLERFFSLNFQKKLYLLTINYFGLHFFQEDLIAKGCSKFAAKLRKIHDRN